MTRTLILKGFDKYKNSAFFSDAQHLGSQQAVAQTQTRKQNHNAVLYSRSSRSSFFLNAGKKKAEERRGKKSTWLAAHRRARKASSCAPSDGSERTEIHLTDELWTMITTHLSPLDVLRLRCVNRQLHSVVERRLNAIFYIDALQCNLSDVRFDQNCDSKRKNAAAANST